MNERPMLGLLALAVLVTACGMRSPFPPTEITHQLPYSDFIGREYRVKSDLSAYAWNDFPDKTKILSLSLMPPPGIRNRFVSYVIPLQRGQRIRLVSAWREFPSFAKYYVVSVPGAGLPEGIRTTMAVQSDGVPDPRVYEPIDRWPVAVTRAVTDLVTIPCVAEDRPFYAPDYQIPERQHSRGFTMWELRKGDRILTCELRDDERAGAGVDVQLLEDGELLLSRRCITPEAARHVAQTFKNDRLRTG